MAHVLNRCKKLRNIYVNKTIKTSFKEDFENLENVEELKLKPDIVAKSGHLINIIDIACPYDLYIESLYTKKIEKYKCLKQLLSEKGYYCVIDAIIIGSLGAVHNKALSVLLNMNMNKRKSKGLLKWCATSNIFNFNKENMEYSMQTKI